MRIIALDPGGTTGWCLVNAKGLIIDYGQLVDEHHAKLYDLLTNEHPDTVICERFMHRQTLGVDQTALEYIGVAKLWCEIEQVPLVMQTAAQAKGFWTDTKLKDINLYKANKRHAMDAIRHALVYLMKTDDYYVRQLSRA